MDGWTVPGAPPGGPANENDWIVGGAADAPAPLGATVRASFAKQPRILRFLSRVFGPYPFTAAGRIGDISDIGFALEAQTRPGYAPGFFGTVVSGDAGVGPRNAHHCTGDFLSLPN